jgi:hypothetical protein
MAESKLMSVESSEHDLEGLSELLPDVKERNHRRLANVMQDSKPDDRPSSENIHAIIGASADSMELELRPTTPTTLNKPTTASLDDFNQRKLSMMVQLESSGIDEMNAKARPKNNGMMAPVDGVTSGSGIGNVLAVDDMNDKAVELAGSDTGAGDGIFDEIEQAAMELLPPTMREPPVIPHHFVPRNLDRGSTGNNEDGDDDDDDDDDDLVDDTTFDDYPDSEGVNLIQHMHQQHHQMQHHSAHREGEAHDVPDEFINPSSGQSISTATQTHEVRMPMYLPTFKPATGCTNASDFVVRCFVARLRSGITVVKHGRSRWCKSRLRVLHIHPDGRSLSWKPAEGEPITNKRPPKLDLATCLEVRHAWSPDPQNPMYTGTTILRQKCEAANAHKSFALIFRSRTVDITAVTADQCKVLMEGFSALCFRLQVANLAGRGGNGAGGRKGTNQGRPMPEEDASVTASNTLTNNSKRA